MKKARSNPLDRFNCGPVKFSGGSDALYERHLTFDQVVPVAAATPRDKFEAVARSVRDLLSQRWIKTEQTYQTRNAKRVYYLSLEFLMGRSLANNITNLLLDPVWSQFCKKHKIDPLEIIEQEPDAGLGNGGLGRLAACFLDSMATLGIPGMGSGLRYEYGIFKQTVRDGWQHEQPDHWLARPDPWEVARPNEAVEVRLACSFDIHGGRAADRSGPAVDAHRHSVRPPGGRVRRQDHQHAAPLVRRHAGLLRLPAVQRRRLRRRAGRDAHGRDADARALPGRLDHGRQGAALPAAVLPGGLHAGRRDPPFPRRRQRLVRAARQGRDAAQRHAPDAGGPRADAHPPRRGEARVGRRPGISRSARSPTRTTRCCPKRWRSGRCRGSRRCCRGSSRSSTKSTAASSTTCARRFPGDDGRVARVSLIEEGQPKTDPHGAPRHRRLAQHQRRGGDSLGAAQADRRARLRRAVPRAGSTTRPTASRSGASSCSRIRRSPR